LPSKPWVRIPVKTIGNVMIASVPHMDKPLAQFNKKPSH